MQNKFNKPKLYVISGSSGVGKGTVIKEFLKRNPNFVLSVSCTTRAKRDGEIENESYFYITKKEFQKSIDNNEFLEWASFSDNFYGTKKSFVEQNLAEKKPVLLEIDTQGAIQVKKIFPKAVLIFIAPPSIPDLEFRLRNRKTESEEAIQKRLDFVKFELENSKYFDYLVVNDEVNNAVNEIERAIRTSEAYDD